MNEHDQENGYEKSDINLIKIGVWALGTIGIIVIFIVVLDVMFTQSKEAAYYETVLRPENPELQQLNETAQTRLSIYAVLDRDNEVYQIPISRAMTLIVEEAQNK